MFIERATFKRFFLAPAERNLIQPSGIVARNIALRWSAGPGMNTLSINIWLLRSQRVRLLRQPHGGPKFDCEAKPIRCWRPLMLTVVWNDPRNARFI